MLPSGEKRTYTLQKNNSKRLSEPLVIVLSFLAILLPASLLLMHPLDSVTGLSFIDALFTATSAISVTGLGVVDTGTHFTVLGQCILLVLIQIGGLGQMTISIVLLHMLRLRVTLRQSLLVREELGQTKPMNMQTLVKRIIFFALLAELIGTLLFAIRWVPEFGWQRGLFISFFHAVSAFNNAGFSLFSDSLSHYVGDPLVVLTAASLFIIGGLGFVVVLDIIKVKNFSSLKLHSKLMLVGTFFLLLIGMFLFFFLESHNPNTLGGLEHSDKLLAAFFQSATARTAGFNTVEISALSNASMLVMMCLMFIGAGTTSTGGGIKVTTFVTVALATKAFLGRRKDVVVFGRTLPKQVLWRSLAIVTISAMFLLLAMFILLITEQAPFLVVMFETVSAFATTGVSAGLTSTLSDTGKFVLIVVMIVGRLGPLTLVFLMTAPKTTKLRYPDEEINTG
ncbi:trk system potassium uptake protein TrkH [Sinobacterium caligoides]|uniref:Trk system potassium uptake protein TrkH n=1 Tax=Sinobacterium caligoides TaxID=933926 RepID=A0A3N2E0U9_9GAMM|nr:TrkH family potassium uptake protein [Sinobacterium caligoides]ROS05195.1 trk system potassium uptake protein TrkH [Sinobacterium caligoides]